ncbi:hypothetical protein NDU88_002054 [Pleurodeles waltl]|uniref:Uncharacterized protein n=1 Tax=Pleurodeles waltl TaxID=8319 RepID=A0AAV7WNS9_PLEWA|nr:hypothetical protein NDU88_012467 [Pleurodeles waltl]KAJ1214435.1 hypothetical protein NDU88_002054 [Pleurodeles waltl]
MQLQKKRVRSCSTLQDTHAAVPVCLFRKSVSARDGTQLQRKRERSHQSQNQAIENDACQLHAVSKIFKNIPASCGNCW